MSRRRRTWIAFLAAFCVFLGGGVLDWLVARGLLHAKMMMFGGIAVAAIIGVLVMKVLSDAHDRHSEMMNRLQRIADINHHIRNALQVISYHASSTRPQTDNFIQEIKASVTRIEWVLREVLPERTANHSDSNSQGADANPQGTPS